MKTLIDPSEILSPPDNRRAFHTGLAVVLLILLALGFSCTLAPAEDMVSFELQADRVVVTTTRITVTTNVYVLEKPAPAVQLVPFEWLTLAATNAARVADWVTNGINGFCPGVDGPGPCPAGPPGELGCPGETDSVLTNATPGHLWGTRLGYLGSWHYCSRCGVETVWQSYTNYDARQQYTADLLKKVKESR